MINGGSPPSAPSLHAKKSGLHTSRLQMKKGRPT